LEFLKRQFRLFNKGQSTDIDNEFVNFAIQRINESIQNGEYLEKDIDDDLIILIEMSQMHGATIYNPPGPRKLFEVEL
jgi:hypothetical protein